MVMRKAARVKIAPAGASSGCYRGAVRSRKAVFARVQLIRHKFCAAPAELDLCPGFMLLSHSAN